MTVRRSMIQGRKDAVKLTGKGTLASENTVYTGGLQRSGKSTLRDGGNNQWNR